MRYLVRSAFDRPQEQAKAAQQDADESRYKTSATRCALRLSEESRAQIKPIAREKKGYEQPRAAEYGKGLERLEVNVRS